jgi:DNA-binding transcriptional LysR family regulator
MDRIDAMQMFVTAVDEGSLAAATRRHGRSPATVTRAIALLEHYAGTTLLLRSTRRLAVTAAGERHLAAWREVLARLADVATDGFGTPLSGTIVLTAPELFGRLKVMPLVENFLQTHPKVSCRVILVNRVVNVIGEGVDLAVRLAPLPDSTLTATRIGQLRNLACASPDYLARRGSPASPEDLGRHECIGLNADSDAELWPFGKAAVRGARVRSVRVHTRISVNHQAAVIDAGLRGQGIFCALSYQVAEHIAAGRLVRILEDFEPPAVPAHIVFPSDRSHRGSVRAFIDHAASVLKKDLLRIEAVLSA